MIFAFYSFKGGVGRTVSLVHAGIRLAATRAEKGYRVLLIDMDLEAPGLDIYVRPKGGDGTPGFAGLLKGYRENGRQRKWLEAAVGDDRFVSPVEGAGNLWVMPSGIKALVPEGERGKHAYLDVIAALRDEIPAAEFPVPPREGFFSDLAQVLRSRFTYVLIDSRSGLADQAYASTLLLADALVLCFRLNRANIEGIQTVLGNFLLKEGKCLGAEGVPAIAVATPIPPRGGADLERWISVAAETFFGRKRPDREVVRDGRTPGSDEPLPRPVHRVFLEPALEIGEKLIFNTDGSLKEGFSQQTPIAASLHELADRIAALNCDADAIAARQVELRYYNEKHDYQTAMEYLLKRIRLEPLESGVWDDFAGGYAAARDCRAEAKRQLGQLIVQWRGELDPSQPSKEPNKARRLAHALHAWTRCFGKDQFDAGLSSIEECLSLCCGDKKLEEEVHYVYGGVIDELVNERRSASLLRNERVTQAVSLELANEHYSRSIALGLENHGKGGNALVARARDLARLHKHAEAVADYDARILETPPIEAKGPDDHHLMLLYEQGQSLEWLGCVDWAFRNYRVALVAEPANPKMIGALYIVSRQLELTGFESECASLWEREDPRNPSVHRQRAITFLVRGDYAAAIEESRIANLYSAQPRMGVLDAFIHLLSGSPEHACDVMPDTIKAEGSSYNKAIYAIALSWVGKGNARRLVEEQGSQECIIRAIAALSLRDLELARRILGGFDPEEDTASWVCLWRALRMACAEIRSDDASQDLEALKASFGERPLIPLRLRNTPEALLFRRTYERLRSEGGASGATEELMRTFWGLVDAAKNPDLKNLPARKLSERVPVGQVLSDADRLLRCVPGASIPDSAAPST